MGAWGPGLFSDDVAMDVRGDYRELLEDQVPDDEATARVLASYSEMLADPDDGPTVWLALAVTQSKVGRLDPAVRAQALRVLYTGQGLGLWVEQGAALLRRRQEALGKARTQLEGPQPARKRMRPPTKPLSDLSTGDVLMYHLRDRSVIYLRVAHVRDNRYWQAPAIQVLDYQGPPLPLEAVSRIPDLITEGHRAAPSAPPWRRLDRFTAANSAKTGTYESNGFSLVARLPVRAGDEVEDTMGAFGGWEHLAEAIEREAGRAPLASNPPSRLGWRNRLHR